MTSPPYGTPASSLVYKEYYGTTWQSGLVTRAEWWYGGVKQKWTTTNWTQDNYQTNPRVTETNIYDASNNRRRTTLGYTAPFNLPEGGTAVLPSDVYEWDFPIGSPGVVLRRSHTDFTPTSNYLSLTRRVLGLPAAKYSCDGAGSQVQVQCDDTSGTALVSKVSFQYDAAGAVDNQGAPTHHDWAFDSP